jgi:hypothetical protein
LLSSDPARAQRAWRGGRSLRAAQDAPLMFFFSSGLGCFGSLVVSAIGTLILLLIIGVININ